VASGRYPNANEVLRADLRMVEETEPANTTKGNTGHFTGDEFASYLSGRANQLTGKKPSTSLPAA
jgi:antitoxin ParD1/3/4